MMDDALKAQELNFEQAQSANTREFAQKAGKLAGPSTMGFFGTLAIIGGLDVLDIGAVIGELVAVANGKMEVAAGVEAGSSLINAVSGVLMYWFNHSIDKRYKGYEHFQKGLQESFEMLKQKKTSEAMTEKKDEPESPEIEHEEGLTRHSKWRNKKIQNISKFQHGATLAVETIKNPMGALKSLVFWLFDEVLFVKIVPWRTYVIVKGYVACRKTYLQTLQEWETYRKTEL